MLTFRNILIFLKIILPRNQYSKLKKLYNNFKKKYRNKYHSKIFNINLFVNKFIYKFSFCYDFLIKKKLNKLTISKIQKKNKKVLLVIGDLTYGGAERQIILLANNLIKKNLQVTLVSNTTLGSVHSKEFIKNIDKKVKLVFLKNIETLIFDKPIRKKKLIDNFKKSKLLKEIIDKKILNFLRENEIYYFYNLHKFIEKNKPDIIHSYLDFWNILCGIIGLNLGIRKIILSCRNMPPNLLTYNRFYFVSCYKFLKNFSNIKIINNSKAGAVAYENWMKAKKNLIKVHYNFFNFKKHNTKKIKRKKSSIIIGSVARFAPEKNLIYMMRLFKNILQKQKNVELFIIGEGYLKEKLQRYIYKHNLNNFVSLNSPKKNIYDYMKYFDCFLLTSKLEGTPNVLLESQSVGTPVFTTNVGGASETIVKNYSGFLLFGNNINNDTNIILKYFKKKNFLKKRNIKIIKSKLSRFKPKNTLNQILKIYE